MMMMMMIIIIINRMNGTYLGQKKCLSKMEVILFTSNCVSTRFTLSNISYINNDDGFTLIVWPFAVSYTLMEF